MQSKLSRLFIGLVLGGGLLSGAASAAPHASGYPVDGSSASADFERLLSQALAKGQLDRSDYFEQRFLYVFSPEDVDGRYLVDAPEPLKDTTWLVEQYRRERSQLRSETVRLIDGFLEDSAQSPTAAMATYDTPHYRFTYSLTGVDGVPSTDADADGVPDYVENMAIYAEYSWSVEVDQLGFTAPYLSPSNDNKMPVGFKQQNSYGYTRCPQGVCNIVIENDFAGFPADDDPEGPVAGASKVTFAHELKHTVQYAASQWSENGWVELDATWMEDVAYNYVNDYVSYINSSQSQIVVPTDALDKGGSGSYYDAIWEISMSERFGNKFIVDFWKYRSTHMSENVLSSFEALFKQYGTTLAEHFSYDYFPRNYMTNARTAGTLVYPDAKSFSAGPVVTMTIGTPGSGSLNALAGVYLEAISNNSSSAPVLTFSAGSRTAFGLVAVQWKKDGTVSSIPVKIVNGAATFTLGVPWSGLNKLGLVLSNGNYGRMASAASYNLTVK